MIPTIFVFDLDHTLIYFDEEGDILTTPSYYIRSFASEILTFLKKLDENNLMVLWTRGIKEYAMDALKNTKLGENFNYVLSEDDCKKSIRYFKFPKSKDYLEKFICEVEKPVGLDEDSLDSYNWILIDDKAVENGGKTYDDYYEIKPYLKSIVKKERKDNKVYDTELFKLGCLFVDEFLDLHL